MSALGQKRTLGNVALARINAQSLLNRLELGVSAPPGEAREVIRELYVTTRRQVKAPAACLELQGLE